MDNFDLLFAKYSEIIYLMKKITLQLKFKDKDWKAWVKNADDGSDLLNMLFSNSFIAQQIASQLLKFKVKKNIKK